jgi:hypothetical protein
VAVAIVAVTEVTATVGARRKAHASADGPTLIVAVAIGGTGVVVAWRAVVAVPRTADAVVERMHTPPHRFWQKEDKFP